MSTIKQKKTPEELLAIRRENVKYAHKGLAQKRANKVVKDAHKASLNATELLKSTNPAEVYKGFEIQNILNEVDIGITEVNNEPDEEKKDIMLDRLEELNERIKALENDKEIERLNDFSNYDNIERNSTILNTNPVPVNRSIAKSVMSVTSVKDLVALPRDKIQELKQKYPSVLTSFIDREMKYNPEETLQYLLQPEVSKILGVKPPNTQYENAKISYKTRIVPNYFNIKPIKVMVNKS